MKALSFLLVLLAFGADAADTDPCLKQFAKLKRQQTEELAAKLHLDVPQEAKEFFKSAEAGDWIAVSNAFERIATTNGPRPGLKNVLYVPIHETWGAYAEFSAWDGAILQKFAHEALQSIPTGSIYFGGSGWGRFIITAIRDVKQTPEIFVVSQNPLVDSTYIDYLRQTSGSQIWIPGEKDFHQALQQAVEGAKDVNYWMNFIGTLTRAIFDHNKAQHGFYVQESFVIAWMYPYLEPHGLILKLNKDTLAQLDPVVVAKDRQYWEGLTRELLADRRFLANEPARQAFAKLRSAIGGLYMNRRMTSKAEAAFKQAIELSPTMPEAPFRLAQMYVEQNHHDAAVALLEQFRKAVKPDPRLDKAIEQLREMKHEPEQMK